MKSFFTPREVSRLIGISYRQIQYWDKTKFLGPSYRRRGKYRLYTFSDIILLKIAVTLRSSNVSIQRLRRIMRGIKELLPQVNSPLRDLTFLIKDTEVLIFSGPVIANNQAVLGSIWIRIAEFVKQIETMFVEEPWATEPVPSEGPKAVA